MKKPETESKRWLDQAKYDLHASRWKAKGNLFAPAYFWAQQSAEKAAKAYLYFNGERFVIGHSVAEFLEKCKAYDKDFKALIPMVLYWTDFTYPRGIPMASPEESLHMLTEERILPRQSKWPRRILTSSQGSSRPIKNSLVS